MLDTRTKALVAVALMAAPMIGVAMPARGRELPSQLRCRVAGGFGFFVAGRRAITCTYYRPDDRVEFYTGSSDKLGIDLGPSNAQKLNFIVKGATVEQPGELDGKFVGAQAGIDVGFGASSEALVGGATGHVALIPFTPVLVLRARFDRAQRRRRPRHLRAALRRQRTALAKGSLLIIRHSGASAARTRNRCSSLSPGRSMLTGSGPA